MQLNTVQVQYVINKTFCPSGNFVFVLLFGKDTNSDKEIFIWKNVREISLFLTIDNGYCY